MTQVRGSAQALIRFAKRSGAAIILVGHVTKDGQIAGPRVVEHMVDAVLSFEGEGSHQFRILRAVKNRFGPTDEIGVFEMTGAGLREVANPSELFLSERDLGSPGTAVFAGIEGTRPLLVEIQALVAPTSLGTPRRAVVGWDPSRLSMVLAVLEAHCGVKLGGHDVYLNVAGGLRIQEPAADLAAAAALVSSLANAPLPADAVYFGEVSLSGAIRPVAQAAARLKEAAKLGFTRAVVPEAARAEAGRARPQGHRCRQASPTWSPTSPPAATGARPAKPVDKTGDGTVTPRYTRGARNRLQRPFQAVASASRNGPKIKHLRPTLPPCPGAAMAFPDSPRHAAWRASPLPAERMSPDADHAARHHPARRHADLRPARHDPRLHARDPVDRRLGRRRGGHALCLFARCCRSRSNISTATSWRPASSIGGVFLLTLLIVSIITVRISDMILDSRVGALDRTLGFLFGLGRGLIIVVVAFLFFAWLVPDRSQPEWVRDAKSKVVLQSTGTMADVHVAG